MTDRDKSGKFVPSENSLHPKTIGLRLHRKYYDRFMAIAEEKQITSVELARAIIQEWMDAQNSKN